MIDKELSGREITACLILYRGGKVITLLEDKQLTLKQEMFVKEYLIDLNATKAAVRAGYSAHTAGSIGEELLKKPHVRAAVDLAMEARGRRTEITADRVVSELAKLGFSDITDFLEVKTERILVDRDPETGEPISEIRQMLLLKNTADIPKEKLAAIAEIRNTPNGLAFKLHDKKGALDSIGKHLGMFTENVNIKVKRDYSELSTEELQQMLAEKEKLLIGQEF